MTSVIAWLKASSLAPLIGVPVAHWVFIFFGVGAILEYILGRSKNPKLRSFAGILFTGLEKLCKFAHIDQFPIIKQILGLLTPPPDATK